LRVDYQRPAGLKEGDEVEATIEHRTIPGQITCWAKVGTASRPR